jgi:hypothetical protein
VRSHREQLGSQEHALNSTDDVLGLLFVLTRRWRKPHDVSPFEVDDPQLTVLPDRRCAHFVTRLGRSRLRSLCRGITADDNTQRKPCDGVACGADQKHTVRGRA